MTIERLLEVLATQAVEDRCDYCQREFVWFRPMPPVCPTCGLENVRERITGVRAVAAHDAQERAIAASTNVVEFARPASRPVNDEGEVPPPPCPSGKHVLGTCECPDAPDKQANNVNRPGKKTKLKKKGGR